MSFALSIIFIVVLVAVIVAAIAGLWMTFEKAGESGWKAIIPIYNLYILIKISGHSGWWLVLPLLPLLIIIFGAAVVGNFESVITNSGSNQMGLSGLAGILVNLFSIAVQMTVIVGAVVTYDVARSFGKGLGFTLGLSVLPFIFWPIIGFGEATYRGPVAHPKMVSKGSGAHLPKDKKSDSKETKKEKKEASNESSGEHDSEQSSGSDDSDE